MTYNEFKTDIKPRRQHFVGSPLNQSEAVHRIPKQINCYGQLLRTIFNLTVSVTVTDDAYNSPHKLTHYPA